MDSGGLWGGAITFSDTEDGFAKVKLCLLDDGMFERKTESEDTFLHLCLFEKQPTNQYEKKSF